MAYLYMHSSLYCVFSIFVLLYRIIFQFNYFLLMRYTIFKNYFLLMRYIPSYSFYPHACLFSAIMILLIIFFF